MQEKTFITIDGCDIEDTITHKDGTVEKIVQGDNIVVNSILPLLMSLLKNDSTYKGITYWAVGSGAESWDTSPIEPVSTETTLTKEIGRKLIDPANIKFLDAQYVVTNVPTTMLEVSVMFAENECNGAWREFGLYGGKATATANSGIMLDKKHHKVLTKTTDMSIERKMRFTISFA